MLEAFQENEFWATVVNSSANWVVAGAMVIQTVLFFITYKFGLRYLNQHKEKLRAQYSADIAKSIILSLHQLNRIGESLFENIHSVTVANLLNSNPYLDIPDQFKDRYGRLTLLLNNLENRSGDINTLISEILVLTDFLKDEEATASAQDINFSFWALKNKILTNQLIIDSESDHVIQEMEAEERLVHLFQKGKEFRGFVPQSFHDSSFIEIKNYLDTFQKFRKYLLKKHRP